MKHVDDDHFARDQDQSLLALLDRQELPGPGLAAGFTHRLAERLDGERPAPGRSLAGQLFQRFWPSRPAWAFAWSGCMLVTGVVTGAWLPLPAPADPQSTNPSPATALVCPVQTSPALWLPALPRPSIA